jgi:hypothetical protein
VSHSRSARKPDGSFDVEVRDWEGAVVHAATYPSMAEANAAGAHWERLVTMAGGSLGTAVPLDEILSDEDLMRELGI